jgi:hypothetical protein
MIIIYDYNKYHSYLIVLKLLRTLFVNIYNMFSVKISHMFLFISGIFSFPTFRNLRHC